MTWYWHFTFSLNINGGFLILAHKDKSLFAIITTYIFLFKFNWPIFRSYSGLGTAPKSELMELLEQDFLHARCVCFPSCNQQRRERDITNNINGTITSSSDWVTDSVEVADGYLMPVTVIELNARQRECSNTSNIRAKWEWELNVTINQLQCHEVMHLIVASIVEEHAIPLFSCKATTDTVLFIRSQKKPSEIFYW